MTHETTQAQEDESAAGQSLLSGLLPGKMTMDTAGLCIWNVHERITARLTFNRMSVMPHQSSSRSPMAGGATSFLMSARAGIWVVGVGAKNAGCFDLGGISAMYTEMASRAAVYFTAAEIDFFNAWYGLIDIGHRSLVALLPANPAWV